MDMICAGPGSSSITGREVDRFSCVPFVVIGNVLYSRYDARRGVDQSYRSHERDG
jgi:hypothetical protein